MTEFETGEFWNALGRLYDSTVKLHEASGHLLEIVQSHEKRLDRAEVRVQAILEELKRRREGRN